MAGLPQTAYCIMTQAEIDAEFDHLGPALDSAVYDEDWDEVSDITDRMRELANMSPDER